MVKLQPQFQWSMADVQVPRHLCAAQILESHRGSITCPSPHPHLGWLPCPRWLLCLGSAGETGALTSFVVIWHYLPKWKNALLGPEIPLLEIYFLVKFTLDGGWDECGSLESEVKWVSSRMLGRWRKFPNRLLFWMIHSLNDIKQLNIKHSKVYFA